MILKKTLDLIKNIDEYRRNMFELVAIKGISDSEVIRISQKLDGEIISLQKIVYEVHSSEGST